MKKALAYVYDELKASVSHESVKTAVVVFFFPSKFCSMFVAKGRKKKKNWPGTTS